MNISLFALKVAELESGKKQISIAQIKEVLRIVNELTHGLLYVIVRWMK